MRVILIGNLLSLRQGKDSNGTDYFSAKVLSGDDVASVKFDNSSKRSFDTLIGLDRMDECSIECEMKFFNGNTFFKAVND